MSARINKGLLFLLQKPGGLAPRTHKCNLQPFLTPVPKESSALSGFLGHCMHAVHIHNTSTKQTHKIKISKPFNNENHHHNRQGRMQILGAWIWKSTWLCSGGLQEIRGSLSSTGQPHSPVHSKCAPQKSFDDICFGSSDPSSSSGIWWTEG